MERTAAVVVTGGEELRENIVGVRSADESVYGQSHFARVVSRENIAEVAGGNGEVYLVAVLYFVLLYHVGVRREVVDDLRNESAPVYGVRGRKSHVVFAELRFYRGVGENALNARLCVVEVSVDGAYAHIAALLGRHLQLLHGAYAVLGVENENACARNILKAFKRRLARVARGGNENDGFLSARHSFCRAGEKVRKELQSHILECTGRAVP